MEITAPRDEGLHQSRISFAAEGLGLPHRGAATTISFVVTPPAAHRVRVTLRNGESGLPISDAQVRFGAHRKATDDAGHVSFDVANGLHRLFVWKADCEFTESTHDVQQDMELAVEGKELPKPSPYARWEG
jgi:hypothetical protein